jgi:UDP-glucuronate 4-epimerase
MATLVTGAAGFIGYHLCERLLARGERVIGLDVLNDYYDVGLKQARLDRLTARAGFSFVKLDIADRPAMAALAAVHPEITRIVNLAGQAGVRYSM